MTRKRGLVTIGLGMFLLVVLVASVASSSANNDKAASAPPKSSVAARTHVVRVYYFHTTQRCASCKKIEAFSAEAIRAGFEREMGDGRLEWEVVNVDDPPNRHFTADYELYTKSLIVVDRVNGQQVRWKNLPKIWELLQDETAFRIYVQHEVRDYLEKPS
jgi:hypothetical protein